MARLLVLILDWLMRNAVQKILMGTGLALVSYLAILTTFRAAFYSLLDSVADVGADLLNLMGIFGIDYVISAFLSAAIFLITINSGKLAIRKK